MTKLNKSRKFIATSATAALVASAIVPVASAAQINDFNSVAPFAKEAVQDLNDRGVIKGDQKGNFNPRNNVTRAEAATILTNALGLEGSGSTTFADVKTSAWYYDAIDAAVSNGIFQGQGAGKFNPSGNLTRSEAAIILVDAFGLEGSADLSEFKDSASVKSWAQEALEIAVANEVMKGDAGNLKPNASISRQEFAVMYHRTEALEVAEETVTGSVKAINNTTVEVTFENEVDDVKALDFAIEGLQITNASVKQTNKKTVVLTTSAQTADVEYTVTLDGEALGKFKGVSAVIPTAVDLTTKSIQGVLGKEVTVSAKVTVPAGQSAAGIPVTFYVNESATGLNKAVTAEAITNNDGVATYSYTRYVGANDSVTAYSTGDRSKFSNAMVYWGAKERLTLTSATGNTVNNGDAKTYTATYLDVHGNPISNAVLDITLAENIDEDVTNDSTATLTDPTTNAITKPYESKTNSNTLEIKTNAKGEATFTVSGANSKSTPIVFVDDNASNNRLGATELQTKANQASFVGGQYTFEFDNETTVEGVRGLAKKYTVTVKKADGKPYAGGTASVDLFEDIDGVLATTTDATLSNTNSTTGFSKGFKTLQLNSEGKASFWVLSSTANMSATPVVWVDINNASNTNGRLEAEESNKKAGSVVFRDEQLASAKLVDITDDQYGAYVLNGTAEYRVQLLNQNGTVSRDVNTGIERVTYTLRNTGNSPLTVNLQANDFVIDNVTNTSGPTTGNGTHIIAAGNSITVTGATVVGNKRDKDVVLNVTGTGLAAQNTGSLEVAASATYNLFNTAGAVASTGHYAAGSEKTTWVNATPAAATEEVTGKVVGFNTSDAAVNHGTVVVLTDAGAYRTFTYALSTTNSDQFLVGTDGAFTNLSATTIADFENKLSVDDRISRVFNGTVNQVRLLNVDGKTNDQATTNTVIGSVADVTAPTLQSAVVQANGNVRLTFSENVSGLNAADYVFLNSSNVAVSTAGNTVANSVGTAVADNEWVITVAAGNVAATSAASTLEYRGSTTVDVASNALLAGSTVAVTQLASFTVTDINTIVGANAVAGKYTYDLVLTTPAAASETITVALAGTTESVTISAADAGTITNADQLAAAVAAAINADTTLKYSAVASGARLVVTQKVASTTAANIVTGITLTGSTPTFAGTATEVTTLAVAPALATNNAKEFRIAGNTTNSLLNKNVTITVEGTSETVSVQFAAGDTTSAAVAGKIAAAFAGKISGYNVTVTNTNNVTVSKATAGAVSSPAITLTVQ